MRKIIYNADLLDRLSTNLGHLLQLHREGSAVVEERVRVVKLRNLHHEAPVLEELHLREFDLDQRNLAA